VQVHPQPQLLPVEKNFHPAEHAGVERDAGALIASRCFSASALG